MKTESFTHYMSRIIEGLKSEERYGTAYIYGYALKAFHKYRGKDNIPLVYLTRLK